MNVNTRVHVNLTQFGLDVLKKAYSGVLVNEWDFLVKDGNRIKVPLWELMYLFGPVMVMGSTKIPFVGNEIAFDEESHESRDATPEEKQAYLISKTAAEML